MVYCGIEDVKGETDNLYAIEIKKKFDSTCIYHNTGSSRGMTHDDPSIFFQVTDSSIIPYTKANEKCFYLIFNGIEEDTTLFVPPVIKRNNKSLR